MYEIRSKDGLLIANCTNNLAGYVINNSSGRWQERNFEKIGKCNVYVVDNDIKIGNVQHTGLEIFLWEGCYLKHYV